ncbi:DegQ family serine endoprotease [Thermochromatium tepidum]|uniref:Probable periplasmic serine endoprotease DegP-like n=1 Tax=Thermochromatium tepidum ATCC 43061 TaxID=316276 RepID=A0A6I6DVR9_THETI|nr:DegQ family serine endoprotease [Thermochromatium tepidum]QGU31654.1 Do family serine endopeptidase [Thermochromatium tepidum ATCC 43061]
MRPTSKLSLALALVLICLSSVGPVFGRDLPDFTRLVAENGPTVVNISTKQSSSIAQRLYQHSIPGLPDGSPLEDLFRHFFDDEGPSPDDRLQSRSLGSGFVISGDGYVVTNAHVVEGAEEIVVRTSDRREFVAKLVGTDKRSDIALLKIEAEGLPAVRIGSGKDLKVGEWVLAIGSPFGFESSATAGIVSATGRSLPSENYVPFIQTDVAINPGNSGGPLFNLDGKVVGVNSQIYSRTGGFMGLSFAIPIEVAMDVVEQLKTKGRVSRGWLGVLIQDVTRELAESFGMPQPLGALVAQVLPDSPAAAAGLQPGDVILSYNGRDIPTSSSLPPLVGATPVGEHASLVVLRRGERIELKIRIQELPEDNQLADHPEPFDKPTVNRLGLLVRDLTPEMRQQLKIEHGGVLVESVDQGPAASAGLSAGDVILMLDNQPIMGLADFERILAAIEPGRVTAVLVQRGDTRMFYALRLTKP